MQLRSDARGRYLLPLTSLFAAGVTTRIAGPREPAVEIRGVAGWSECGKWEPG